MDRPRIVTVFGVLNLVFGLLGLCGAGLSLLILSQDAKAGDPLSGPYLEHPWYLAYTKASIIVSGATLLVLALSGVGLLLMKGWGRRLAVLYGASALVLNAIGLLLEVTVYIPSLFQHTAQMPEGPVRMGLEIGARVSLVLSAIAGLAYPFVLLIVATRRKFVAAFEPPPAPPTVPASR